MATILVSGGTGFIGRHIIRLLCQLGYRVRVASRNPNKERFIKGFCHEFLTGDLSDLSFARKCCSGIDAVIHLIGILVEQGQDTFKKVHVQVTKNMIQASKENGVSRFIHMSSLGTRPNAKSRYHQTKWTAEEMVRKSELDWTIFQPSVVFGIGDDFTKRLYKMFFIKNNPLLLFPLIEGAKSKLQPIFVENVAEAFVRAIPNQKTFHKTYPLTGPEIFSLKEIILLIMEEAHLAYKIEAFPFHALLRTALVLLNFIIYPFLGFKAIGQNSNGEFWAIYFVSWLFFLQLLKKDMKRRILFHLPVSIATPFIGITEKWMKNPPLTHDMLLMMLEDNIADSSEAVSEFDLKLVSLKKVLPDILESLHY
ncbi:complex I NDUFA9 subunit family protein [Methylacidiphilum caldifontis]|uniref:complex I NDUFA9 subunit family protein n=1 Tax=Methylacidiphilum caldifontis TaxID=2795386 RepID=UPI001A8C657E|nr:complex I NDUFA9 subunit family protein [Methylacidiphilum caldifontis]QSR88031.1 complex I NDUFA9 subunit family protein [Methylacidiphilum caldifontis]